MSRGAVYMILSSLVFSIGYIFIKKATQAVGFWEAAFMRGLLGWIIVSAILLRKGKPLLGTVENRKWLAVRGLLGATAMVLYFLAFQKTSMANASALHFTHPLFTTMLALPILGEKVTWKKMGLVLLALFGVMIIFRPDRGVVSLGSLAGLMSGLFASLAYLTIRALTAKEEPAAIINALCIAAMIITAPFMLANWSTPTLTVAMYLLMVGILTTVAQFLMTHAYKQEEASQIAGFSFIAIFWAILFGKIIFGEIPSRFEIVGICLIFLSMVGLAMIRTRKTIS
ncbi:DMT family transporter [Myxococcota bacterium]|nr:DMT family transporter [Myxococcota bacterium]